MTLDQIVLHSNTKIEKSGVDNPGLILEPTRILAPSEKYSPPSYTPEKSYKNGVNGMHSVYNVSEKPPKDAGEEYNPYINRNVKHSTTFWETLIHMLKASLGTGILAMPNAFHNSGYLVGTIGTVIIGMLCTYTIHILIRSEYELCRRKKVPSMTYPETAEAALELGPKSLRKFAPYSGIVCNTLLLTYQIGSCCIYVVFVATNIKAVADEYVPVMSVRIYMCILLLPLILINWVRNLKYLAPFSSIANAATLVSFGIIGYYMFSDIKSIEDRSAVANFSGMPLFFGTVLFAMEAIGVVMPLENEMQRPEKFGSVFGVLNVAMVPITIMYTIVGFFGYLRYGSEAAGSITLNLPNDQILAQSVKLMLSFSIYITHALACYVAVDITWNQKLKGRISSKKLFWEYVTRTGLVLITFGFAVAIPNLELFISLMGALCLSTMGLSFPALIQMLTFWDEYKGVRFLLFFLRNLTVILISILGFLAGTSTSLHEIYLKFFQ